MKLVGIVKDHSEGTFVGYYTIPTVHNIYTEESILLSYTPVEGHIVKL